MIHPAIYAIVNPDADYFALTQYSEDYLMDGRSVDLTYWHRPLHAVINAFTAAGFRILTLSEPPPAPDTLKTCSRPAWAAGPSSASSSSPSSPSEAE